MRKLWVALILFFGFAGTVSAQACLPMTTVQNGCAQNPAVCYLIYNDKAYILPTGYGSCASGGHMGMHLCGADISGAWGSYLSWHLGRSRFNAIVPTPICAQIGSSDLNNDGKVNQIDFNLEAKNYGRTGAAGFIGADIIKDGGVDYRDWAHLVSNYR